MTQDSASLVEDPAFGRDMPIEQFAAILALGKTLKAVGYRFVAPTPLTHGRILSRVLRPMGNPLVEAFGWNRPINREYLGEPYWDLLRESNLLEKMASGDYRSLVRFSTLGDFLFAHSGYPTDNPNAVFFGPDTYRFCRAVRWLADHEPDFYPRTIIDIGAGSGAGGIFATFLFPGSNRTILTDINPKAIAFSQINAAVNDVEVEAHLADILVSIDGEGDLVISNPPYLLDIGERTYRHGGGEWGCALSVRILEQALSRLTPNGRLLLYTGSPIVQGIDMFLEAAQALLADRVCSFRYDEQDPDVFGEELEKAPYDQVDRIATVVLHVKGTDIIR